MAAEEPRLLRGMRQEGLLMQLQLLLLQMVRVIDTAITTTCVVCTGVESAVDLCGVVKRPEHGNQRCQRNGFPEPNNPIFGVEMQFFRPVKNADMAETAENAPISAAAATRAASEAGLLDVAQLSWVVERCHNVPQNVGWITDWVPQPRGPIQRDPRPIVCVVAGERRKR